MRAARGRAVRLRPHSRCCGMQQTVAPVEPTFGRLDNLQGGLVRFRSSPARDMLGMLTLVVALGLALAVCARDRSNPRADREALFTYIVDKTMERTAFSPFKDIEATYRARAEALKEELLNADTDQKLYYALRKLSNARTDRHLEVEPVEGGISIPRFTFQAPIAFATDYGDPGHYTLFVSDYDRRVAELASGSPPDIGDVLVAVNGTPIDTYVGMMTPYCRYSTRNKLWWELATFISRKASAFGPELYEEQATYQLAKADGRVYTIELPYLKPEEVQWAGYSQKKYPGFEKAFETPAYSLYLPTGDQRAILLDWNGFVGSARDDTDRLIAYAKEHDLLDHDIIFDATSSGGGSQGAYVLSRLSPRPFKTTFGNIRISDITEGLVAELKKGNDLEGGSLAAGDAARGARQEDVQSYKWLVDWLDTDVARAVRDKRAYSSSAPFKLTHLPKDSDGIMQPAEVHFRGQLVVILGPSGGSHLDQFVAMVVDNRLGYVIGVPAAGHSNTWEWTEVLHYPISGKPVASYMWNVGHTIRPNGEVLEGNPAQVDERAAVTRESYRSYYGDVVGRALEHLKTTGGTDANPR